MKPFLLFFILILFGVNKKINTETFLDERDGNEYSVVALNDLKWLRENLRYQTSTSICSNDSSILNCVSCGQFYLVEDAFKVCPKGWRLPTEKEVKALIKLDKRGNINLSEALNILLCGRVDNGNMTKIAEQNTFWIDSALEGGSITHWHVFGKEHDMHNHNVVNAKRQFPIRCVCELN